MASPTLWTWVWVNSGSWWWTEGLACCSPWGWKELDTTEQLNWTENVCRDMDMSDQPHNERAWPWIQAHHSEGREWAKFTLVILFQSLSFVWLFVTPWNVAHQASLSFTISLSLLKCMCIESVMLSNHLILLPPSPPAFSLSQHQGLFQWVSSPYQVAKVLEHQLQHQSFQWIFRVDLL